MEPTTWIAKESVIFARQGGHRSAGVIAVGMPVQIDETEARCAVVLDGLETPIQICGASTLQALLLGVQYLGSRLYDFTSNKGGEVLTPDGNQLRLDAIFGPLLQAAVPMT